MPYSPPFGLGICVTEREILIYDTRKKFICNTTGIKVLVCSDIRQHVLMLIEVWYNLIASLRWQNIL